METPVTPIAIIGIGCRFPGGANSPKKLWQLLISGQDTWTPVPSDRWNEEAFFHPDPDVQGMYNHRGGHFLDQDISEFDGGFFGLAPAECEAMDPQQRIQLEIAYEALESAGMQIRDIKGSDTGVYVATFSSDYNLIQHQDINDIPRYHTTGVGTAIVANRISYLLDLRGPSMTLDTGCSGSLVAIHQACQSLRCGESKMALAGGVNLMLSPDQMTTMSLMRCWNEDGKCYSFDDRGTGYGRGEGAAMVVLKRLDDAIKDGDPIRAIIRNSGINQDGKTNGIMVPKSEAQEKLIKSVYHAVGLDPRDTTFVEAHGTGTAVGDPLEMAAIRSSFRPNKCREPLLVGTVKPNIGHLESTSGIAGLIKGVLMLEHGQLPPTIGISSLKPNLHLKDFGIEIPDHLEDWPEGRPRRLSVNSFGYGGTNAHAILDEAPKSKRPTLNGLSNGVSTTKHIQIIPFSGTSPNTVSALIQRIQKWARQDKDLDMQDISQKFQDLAFTLSERRSAMSYRMAICFSSLQDLECFDASKIAPTKSVSDARVMFVFTGQGAQWYAMGRELVAIQSRFRNSLEKSDRYLKDLGSEWSLLEELSKGPDDTKVNESEISQPATTALQIALVDLLDEVAVKPDLVVGHSSGEIAAAYASGALDYKSALRVAYHRGKISREPGLSKGAMLAVGLGEEAATSYLKRSIRGTAVVACSNSPQSSTISGDEEAIVDIETALKDDGVSFVRRLTVDQAYHSHHMLNLATDYLRSLDNLNCGETHGSVAFVSSVTAAEKSADFTPSYWVQNLVSKVNFSSAVSRALYLGAEEGEKPAQVIVEIGPHNALAGPLRQILSETPNSTQASVLSTLRRGKDAVRTIVDLAVSLFEKGVPIDITRLNYLLWSHGTPKILANLPTYPWNHSKKYWHETRQSREHRFRKYPHHDLVGIQSPTGRPSAPFWRHFLSLSRLPWLSDHQIDGEIIFPASGYLCMVIESLRQLAERSGLHDKPSQFQLRNINFVAPVVVPESGKPIELQLSWDTADGLDWNDFRIVSIPISGSTIEHCRGQARYYYKSSDLDFALKDAALPAITSTSLTSEENISVDDFYRHLKANGNNYGPGFARLKELRIQGKHAYGTISLADMTDRMPYQVQSPHIIHPSTLDTILHPSIALFQRQYSGEAIVTASIDQLTVDSNMQNPSGANINLQTGLRDKVWAQTCLTDIHVFRHGESFHRYPVLSISGLGLRALKAAEHKDTGVNARKDMCYQLQWAPDADWLSAKDVDSALDLPQHDGLKQAVKLEKLNLAASIYIGRCLENLQSTVDGNVLVAGSQQRLFNWMRKFWEGYECRKLVSKITPTEVSALLRDASLLGVEGEVLSRIGVNLAQILQHNLDPLTLITEEDLLWRLYSDDASTRCYSFVAKYLQYLSFKKPNMRVLEIGAGTGSATEPVLEALSSNNAARFQSYDFTDVSTAFFERSQIRLSRWKDKIQFRKLDVQKDPVEQGFDESSYDLVLASNVLHVADSIPTALSQIRKLLRPNGRILMVETTRNVPFYNAILGTFPGWWAGVDDGRTDGPFLSETQWDHMLQRNGLVGTDLVVKDFEEPAHRCAMIVSKPIPGTTFSSQVMVDMEILLCPSWEDRHPTAFDALFLTLSNKFGNISIRKLISAQISPDKVYIVLDDGSVPVLTTSDPTLFAAVTKLANANKVLWISAQVDAASATNPERNLITGFLRSVRAENSASKFITLDVQDTILEEFPTTIFSDIVQALIQRTLGFSNPCDLDYIFKNGQLLIPRVIPDSPASLAVAKAMRRVPFENQDFHQTGRPFCLDVEKARFIDNMEFREDETLQIDLGTSELQVQVQAWGVNFKDILIAGGHARKKLAMAGEFSGIVVNVGSEFQSKFSVGDKVAGFGANPYASQIRVHGDTVARLSKNMSFALGAAIPVAYATAYHALVEIAKLEKDQTVLIHSAAGALGQAAVAIAQWRGAVIFATVGTSAKKDFLIKKFNLAKDRIFSSRTESFRDAILVQTKSRGVDVVMNTLSGQLLHASLECLSPFGVMLELGKTDAHSGTRISMAPFDSSITISSIDMAMIHRHKPALAGALIAKVFSLMENQQLSLPETPTILPINEIQKAFRLMQDRRTHMGKIVLESGPGAVVQAPPRQFSMKYNSNATYIVAGGLGGVGLEIAKYLVKNGARYLILLTRRKVDSAKQAEIQQSISMFSEVEIRILSCNITVLSDLEKKLLGLLRDMPPAQGLLQSAMILKDRIVSEMTLDDYSSCIAPKVKGTQNLIKVLSNQPLRFVVLLSSIVGTCVGTVAESAYAAGNAFMSGMAHSMHGQQPRIISLAPGVIDDVGVLSTDVRTKQILERQGFPAVKVGEIIALVDHALSDEAREERKNEIVSGFDCKSLRESGNSQALENPIFSHVLQTEANEGCDPSVKRKPAIEHSIADANNLEESEGIITSAVTKKIESLLAAGEESLDPGRSVAELGVDSLIVVEVKNWIALIFQVKLQNSEISDASNLFALARLIASKSPLLAHLRDTQPTEKSRDIHIDGDINGYMHLNSNTSGNLNGNTNDTRNGTTNGNTSREHNEEDRSLPKQPLPDLDASLQLWTESVRPILDDETYIKALKLMQIFRAPDGPGQKLQARLQALATDPNVDNWQEDLYNRYHHLRLRDALLPQWNFFGTHPFEGGLHSAAERAAIICDAYREFKARYEAGILEEEVVNDQKHGSHQYQWFWNCTREPHIDEDVMRKYPGNEYLVVFRRGNAFRIPLSLSFENMRNHFQHIIDLQIEMDSWVGVLTTNERNTWAVDRELLQNVSPNNAANLQVIEAAAFVVYLDDDEPTTARERGHEFLHHDGFNRWCDKSTQAVITRNGWSATIGEHTFIDGYAARRLNTFVMDRIRNHKSSLPFSSSSPKTNGTEESLPPIESFILDTTPDLDQRISDTRMILNARTSVNELAAFEIDSLNEALFRKHGISPKSGVQLAIHLTARKFFGFSPIGHETVSLAHFLKGRIEIVHTLWPSVKTFCDEASAPGVCDGKEMRKLLLNAARDHSKNLMRASRGHGIDRHLLCLEWSVEPGENVPDFFTSDIYKSSRPQLLMTDCLDAGVLECGSLPPRPGGMWCHFEFKNGRVCFSIWGPRGKTDQIEKLIMESARQVREILES